MQTLALVPSSDETAALSCVKIAYFSSREAAIPAGAEHPLQRARCPGNIFERPRSVTIVFSAHGGPGQMTIGTGVVRTTFAALVAARRVR